MRKLFLFFILLASSQVLYAGSFIVNHLILGCDKQTVENYVDTLNIHAVGLYDIKNPDKYLLCEEKSDQQDVEYGITLGKKISKDLSVSVLYTLIHDSDIFYSVLITNGEVVFQYNSWPGYWDGEDQEPLIKKIENISDYFGIEAGELFPILNLEMFNSEYVFAEEVLEEFRTLLKIPEYIYLGFTYAKESRSEIIDFGFSYKEW